MGEHAGDLCLSAISLSSFLVPQWCLVFTGSGKHLLLALLSVERGKSSHPKQKNTGICFQVYSSHSLSLQVKSPELAFFFFSLCGRQVFWPRKTSVCLSGCQQSDRRQYKLRAMAVKKINQDRRGSGSRADGACVHLPPLSDKGSDAFHVW